MRLRRWQEECVKIAVNHYKFSNHFLCLATPGAGKSTMAAEVSARLFESGSIDYVLCFSPSISVTQSLKDTFENRLNRRFDGLIGAVGCSHTYQSMCHLPDNFWDIFSHNRVLVVFDEIHHCAGTSLENSNTWGEEIILNVQDKSTYTLALTGTPWRSDKMPITLSRYADTNAQNPCNYTYALKDAIHEKVCRRPNIVLVDNENIGVNEFQKSTRYFQGLNHLFKDSGVPYRVLISNNEAMHHILKQACIKLNEIRRENPRAGGLVVTQSVDHAQKVATILQEKLGQTAVVATYQQADAAAIINNYRNSKVQWIISVGMISEGTDIPRLQVCCHLSSVRTELYFRQVLGRILRMSQEINQEAWLYTFAEPTLVQFSERVGEELPYGDTITRESSPTINKESEASNHMCDGAIVYNGENTFDDLGISCVFSNGFKPSSSEVLISDVEINHFGDFWKRIVSLF